MSRASSLGLALAIGGCHVGPPAAPSDEALRRSQAGNEYLAAKDVREAAATEVEAAEAALEAKEEQLRVLEGRERGAAEGLSAGDRVELERVRGEREGALQRVQAAKAALGHADQDVVAAEEQVRSFDRAEEYRAAEWQYREKQKYRRFMIASVPLNLGGAVFTFIGIYSLAARQSILNGKQRFASSFERDAALQVATRQAIIGYAVGMPMIAVGLTLALLAARGNKRLKRVTMSGDGIGFRF